MQEEATDPFNSLELEIFEIILMKEYGSHNMHYERLYIVLY